MEEIVQIKMRDFGSQDLIRTSLLDLQLRDICIIKTEHGMDYGKFYFKGMSACSAGTQEISQNVILRRANQSDLVQIEQNRSQIKNAVDVCREKVSLHGLPMKVLAAEYSFDRHKIVFYYTAPGRVDFRALVRDLAAVFKTRIDLHQIGPRDEAKVIGGLAPCGKKQVCCTQFLVKFEPITTKMAKIQRLPVHQEKLLGLCGQLKCCLKYEVDSYEEMARNLPKEGSEVSTKSGKGRILALDILRQIVIVRLEDDRELRCSLDEINVIKES